VVGLGTIVLVATRFDYRRQALTYDSTRRASPSVLGPLRAAIGPSNGGVLLDVGGGTGNYAAALASEGWPVVVVDRSLEMVAVAAAKGLPVSQGDASALPAADASAGGVLLVSMLHHVPDWEDALAEARRVVRPGGVVAVMAFAREHLDGHWFIGYLPTALAHFRAVHQPRDALKAALPGCRELPVRYEDVVDGSLAALCRQPERLLDPSVRRQTSFIEWAEANVPDELAAALERLAGELAAGHRPQNAAADVRARLGDAVVLAWTRPP
jgi:SAM-dependent methyltransferase